MRHDIFTMFKHDFGFDPTYGYTEANLRDVKPPAIAEGFDAFWQDTYAWARRTPARAALRRIPSAQPDAVELYELEYDGIGGFRVGGWLTRPVGVAPVRGLVLGHGYGGRDAAEPNFPGPPAVAIYPCARGFNRSARPDLPGDARAHVLHGIEDSATYLHRFCVADLWSAVSALTELAPEVAGAIDYMGTSFGGGVGAMALPWEPRFRRAFLGVPSFGHHPLRVTMRCVGSGDAVRTYVAENPRTMAVLRLFDSAVAAQFCHIPVMVSCALFDPAVPPPGQFAVYNGLAGPKQLFLRKSDHFSWEGTPDEGHRLYLAQAAWFSQVPALS